MVKVGIIGATGYAGNELVRLLMGHKDVEIMWYGSRNYIDKKYAEVYQNMFEIVEDTCLDDNMEELASKVDVIFTATPQGFLAGVLTEEILSRVKIKMCIRDRPLAMRVVGNALAYRKNLQCYNNAGSPTALQAEEVSIWI